MVDIGERLIAPEHAKVLKEAGIKQLSQYAWVKLESGEWALTCEPDTEVGVPQLVDWTNDENKYAAFDLTDMGIMLSTLGYYLSGISFYHEGLPRIAEQKWWADDINSITEFDQDVYQAYGATEAEAKGALLAECVRKGKLPVGWEYFRENKILGLLKHVDKKTYGEPTDRTP